MAQSEQKPEQKITTITVESELSRFFWSTSLVLVVVPKCTKHLQN